MACVPLSSSTVTRQMDETAEDIEAQLLERINESLWGAIQVDESTSVENRKTVPGFVQSVFQEDMQGDMCTCVGNQHHSCRTIQE